MVTRTIYLDSNQRQDKQHNIGELESPYNIVGNLDTVKWRPATDGLAPQIPCPQCWSASKPVGIGRPWCLSSIGDKKSAFWSIFLKETWGPWRKRFNHKVISHVHDKSDQGSFKDCPHCIIQVPLRQSTFLYNQLIAHSQTQWRQSQRQQYLPSWSWSSSITFGGFHLNWHDAPSTSRPSHIKKRQG